MKPNKEEEEAKREERWQNEVEREALKCVFSGEGDQHHGHERPAPHGREHNGHEHNGHEHSGHERHDHDAVAESQDAVSEALRGMGAFDLGAISGAAKAAMDAVAAASNNIGDGEGDRDAVSQAEKSMSEAVEMTSRAVSGSAQVMRPDLGRAREKA